MKDQEKHIDELIVKHLTQDIVSDEQGVLDAWIKQSGENEHYYKQMSNVWVKSQALKEYRTVDVISDFEQFKKRVGMNPKVIKHSFRKSFMRFAAVLVPAIMLMTAYALYQTVPGFGKLQAFSTSENVDSVVLADDSEVSLNSNSRLVYNKSFTGDVRSLQLQGEGYFKVAKNPDKPFIVEVGGAEVTVLGTEFNLEETIEGDIKLAVTEGRVLFSSGGKQLIVEAGEKAICHNGNLKKEALTSSNCIAWKTGKIVFENAALEEVLETLVDHFSEVTSIENSSTETDLSITTRFTNPSLEDVLVELRIHFMKKFEINDNKLIISD